MKWNEANNKKLLQCIQSNTKDGVVNYERVAYIIRLPAAVIRQKHASLISKFTHEQIQILELTWTSQNGIVSFQDLKLKLTPHSILDIKKQLSDSVKEKGLLPFYSFQTKDFDKFDKDFWTPARNNTLLALATDNTHERKINFQQISEEIKQKPEICQKQLFLLQRPEFTPEDEKKLTTLLNESNGQIGSKKLSSEFETHSLFELLLKIDELKAKGAKIEKKQLYFED